MALLADTDADYNVLESPLGMMPNAMDFPLGMMPNATLTVDQHSATNVTYLTAAAIHVVIFLVGIVGNLIVVLTVYKTVSLHSTTYCYLVSEECGTVSFLHEVQITLAIKRYTQGHPKHPQGDG